MSVSFFLPHRTLPQLATLNNFVALCSLRRNDVTHTTNGELWDLYHWVKTNMDVQVEQGEKFYLWDNFVHNWTTDPLPEITGRSCQTLLLHGTTQSSVQDTPSVIEVTVFDVVIYGTERSDDQDTDFWLCHTSCTAHLWTEKHVDSTTLNKTRLIASSGENFLKITFRCSFTERQVISKELALYMCYVKTLHWVDKLVTCTTSNNDSTFVVESHALRNNEYWVLYLTKNGVFRKP